MGDRVHREPSRSRCRGAERGALEVTVSEAEGESSPGVYRAIYLMDFSPRGKYCFCSGSGIVIFTLYPTNFICGEFSDYGEILG